VNSKTPNCIVIGAEAVMRCIALNQGDVLNAGTEEMCTKFSDGALQRANQVTDAGFSDFINEFLVRAGSSDEERMKYWCGATEEEMDERMLKGEKQHTAQFSIETATINM
jgi:hypothetical protein